MSRPTNGIANAWDEPVRTVAFVGAGPTTIYTLCAFVDKTTAPANVTIFEAQPRAGLGTPYRPGWNDPAMLSNIASIEIPPIGETLIDWLRRHPALPGRGIADNVVFAVD